MTQQPQPPLPPTPTGTDGAPTAAPDAHYHMPPINPGQTNGIIGMILPFVGLSPIGLVFSIISTLQSGKANTSRTLGIIGIVFNAVGIVVSLFFLLVIASVIATSGTDIKEQMLDSVAQARAYEVRQHAEEYYAKHGSYPATSEALTTMTDDPTLTIVPRPTANRNNIGYAPCGSDGASVEYLKHSSTVPIVLYLGTGSATTCQ